MSEHHRVKLIAVQHQQAATIGGFVDRRPPDLYTAKAQTGELTEHFVMIARNIDDAGPAPRPFQYPPDDIIMTVGPEKLLLQSPAVNDIADQIERIAVDMIEKVDQQVGVAAARAEMDVRNPDGPIPGAVARMHPRLALEPRFIAINVKQRNIGFGEGGKMLGHKNSHGDYPMGPALAADCYSKVPLL